MKMKVSTRFIFSIYLLVVIAVCLFLLATVLGLLPAANATQIAAAITGGTIWFRVVYAVVFAVMLAVSCSLMFFGIKKEQAKTAVVASLDSGTISIAVSALEEIAKRLIKQTPNVKCEAVKVIPLGEQVELNIKISILPEVSIPQITQDMQKELIQYVEAYSGIKVKQAKIIVASINEMIKDNKIIGGS